ncbi:hypothetical protein AB3S75_009865 [Citrus x aurantiifolia]
MPCLERFVRSGTSPDRSLPESSTMQIYDEDWIIFHCLGKIDKAISCLTYNLKMVELIEVQGSENGLKLVRFQLKNAERDYYLGIVVKNLL